MMESLDVRSSRGASPRGIPATSSAFLTDTSSARGAVGLRGILASDDASQPWQARKGLGLARMSCSSGDGGPNRRNLA